MNLRTLILSFTVLLFAGMSLQAQSFRSNPLTLGDTLTNADTSRWYYVENIQSVGQLTFSVNADTVSTSGSPTLNLVIEVRNDDRGPWVGIASVVGVSDWTAFTQIDLTAPVPGLHVIPNYFMEDARVRLIQAATAVSVVDLTYSFVPGLTNDPAQ